MERSLFILLVLALAACGVILTFLSFKKPKKVAPPTTLIKVLEAKPREEGLAIVTTVIVAPDMKPQCRALTHAAKQCLNSARGKSKYCSSHKGYHPPAEEGLAQRIEGGHWSDEDKQTDRQSLAWANTEPSNEGAKDTKLTVRSK